MAGGGPARCRAGHAGHLPLLRSRRASTVIRPTRHRTNLHKIGNHSIRRSSTTNQHTNSAGQNTASRIRAPRVAKSPPPSRGSRSTGDPQRRDVPFSPGCAARRPAIHFTRSVRGAAYFRCTARPLSKVASVGRWRGRTSLCSSWPWDQAWAQNDTDGVPPGGWMRRPGAGGGSRCRQGINAVTAAAVKPAIFGTVGVVMASITRSAQIYWRTPRLPL